MSMVLPDHSHSLSAFQMILVSLLFVIFIILVDAYFSFLIKGFFSYCSHGVNLLFKPSLEAGSKLLVGSTSDLG